MDRKTIEAVAKNAHIALSDEEIEMYGNDLDDILEYFSILDESPEGEGSGVNPIEVADSLRDDIPMILIDPNELLKDMRTYDNYVRGPRL